MCGRFAQMVELEELMSSISLHVGPSIIDSSVPALLNSRQVAPSQHCAVLTRREGSVAVEEATFGRKLQSPNTTKGSKTIINARVETVLDKPLFKHAVQRNRCTVPVSGYFEWKEAEIGRKAPFFIHPKSTNIGFLAGLLIFSISNVYPSLVIITKEASSAQMRDLHPREPLHLSLTHLESWLSGLPISKHDLDAISSFDDSELEATPTTKTYLNGHDTSLSISPDETLVDPTKGQLRLF